jgi:hypothetical protein
MKPDAWPTEETSMRHQTKWVIAAGVLVAGARRWLAGAG